MEIPEKNEFSYNPRFIAKIKASEQEEKEGKTTALKTDELWN